MVEARREDPFKTVVQIATSLVFISATKWTVSGTERGGEKNQNRAGTTSSWRCQNENTGSRIGLYPLDIWRPQLQDFSNSL